MCLFSKWGTFSFEVMTWMKAELADRKVIISSFHHSHIFGVKYRDPQGDSMREFFQNKMIWSKICDEITFFLWTNMAGLETAAWMKRQISLFDWSSQMEGFQFPSSCKVAIFLGGFLLFRTRWSECAWLSLEVNRKHNNLWSNNINHPFQRKWWKYPIDQ